MGTMASETLKARKVMGVSEMIPGGLMDAALAHQTLP